MKSHAESDDSGAADRKADEERWANELTKKCRDLGIDWQDDEIRSGVLFGVTSGYIKTGKWLKLENDHLDAVIRRTRNWRAKDKHRAKARSGEVTGDSGLFESMWVAATQLAHVENLELAERVEAAIKGLPPEERLILEDFRNGIPPSETANKLGLSASAIGMRRLRTLNKLREIVGDDDD